MGFVDLCNSLNQLMLIIIIIIKLLVLLLSYSTNNTFHLHCFFSLENIDHMFTIGLYLNDLSLHDASRDLVLVGNQKSTELKIALHQVRPFYF